jgi:galactan 5-O-arabinofuranosyltransferase
MSVTQTARGHRVPRERASAEPGASGRPLRSRSAWFGWAAGPLRPWLFALVVGAAVVATLGAAGAAGYDPYSYRVRYGLYFAAMVAAAASVTAMVLARRRGSVWDADLLPALAGGFGSFSLAVCLHGTPFSVLGITSDQSYRSEAVTRFADTWQLADYGYRELPAYYPPLYFWLLGRVADLTGLAPFHMVKLGTIAVAFVAPVVAYVMWRRLVSPRVAALIAIVPLILQQVWEPYGWVVLAAIIPWWLEAIHGIVRDGVRPRRPVTLGLIGAALFCTYYYYFFVFAIVWPIFLAIARRRGELSRGAVLRPLLILAIAALAAAPYWGPLLWHVVTTPGFEPINNWWLREDAGVIPMPMLRTTFVGPLCLIGLGYLAWTAYGRLSRSLLIIAASLYIWHAIGFPFIVINQPLLSHRMRAMVPVVLLIGAAVAAPRLVAFVRSRLPAREAGRVAIAGGMVLALAVTTSFLSATWGTKEMASAHNEPLPNGKLPVHHRAGAQAAAPSAQELHDLIEAGRGRSGHLVVASDRRDIFAFYPYYTFVSPNALYSHPSARFRDRVRFLQQLAVVSDPTEFTRRTDSNPFDRVDVFILRKQSEGALRLTFSDTAFPYAKKNVVVDFARASFAPPAFAVTDLDGYVVAVRRPGEPTPAR